jgi:hypothetical protein
MSIIEKSWPNFDMCSIKQRKLDLLIAHAVVKLH